MGVQDREWYWEDRRRRENLHYNPKSFRRPRFTTTNSESPIKRRPNALSRAVVVAVAAVALAVFVGQWRRHDIAARQMAEAAEQQQKARLQAAARERLATMEQAARLDRLRQDEAIRQRAASAQREAESLARASAADEERRRTQRWERFYKPEPGCERSATVECANAFIRARKRFNELHEREGRPGAGP